MLNILLIGTVTDIALALLPTPEGYATRFALLGFGILLNGIAGGAYIGAGFGPGPRDGLMTGLHARTGWPIWVVRTGIEATVLVAGFLLGGQVGIGTLAFALLIGPMVNATLPLLRVPERATPTTTAKEVPA